MKNLSLFVFIILLTFMGCKSNSCKKIPYWDGKSVKDFEGKTMTSMLWLWPPPYEDRVGICLERSRIFKRFDEADYEVLLQCLKNPEVKRPVQKIREERLGRYLYLSFLDGSRYIVDFSFWHEEGEEHVNLLNGQSKILYTLLGEKAPCPDFDCTGMDSYGRAIDPLMR